MTTNPRRRQHPDRLDLAYRRLLAEQITPPPPDFHNDPLELPSLYCHDRRVQTWDQWLTEHQQAAA